jgi:hypothetical protein
MVISIFIAASPIGLFYEVALATVPPVKDKLVIANSPTAPATGVCAARNVPVMV